MAARGGGEGGDDERCRKLGWSCVVRIAKSSKVQVLKSHLHGDSYGKYTGILTFENVLGRSVFVYGFSEREVVAPLTNLARRAAENAKVQVLQSPSVWST